MNLMKNSFGESYEPEDEEELFQLGLQPLDMTIYKGLYCKYGVNGECEGVNDLDYIRCSTLNIQDCLIYQIKESEKDYENETRIISLSNPLEETVEIVPVNSSQKDSHYDSIHDAIADDEEIEENYYIEIRHTLRTSPMDYRADY